MSMEVGRGERGVRGDSESRRKIYLKVVKYNSFCPGKGR